MSERTASPAVVREWGRAHGWKLGDRGRVPAELWAEYADAQESRIPGDLVGRLEASLTAVVVAHEEPAAASLVADAVAGRLVRTGHTFAWERRAYVVRDPEGVECFRSPLGGDCARWATEAGIYLVGGVDYYDEERPSPAPGPNGSNARPAATGADDDYEEL